VKIKYISPQQAGELTSLSFRQIARLELAGKFPRRVKLSDRRFGYVESEVGAWNEARLAERDKPPRGGDPTGIAA
jgi:prophage regulatory protein